jgi:hypothetical protein
VAGLSLAVSRSGRRTEVRVATIEDTDTPDDTLGRGVVVEPVGPELLALVPTVRVLTFDIVEPPEAFRERAPPEPEDVGVMSSEGAVRKVEVSEVAELRLDEGREEEGMRRVESPLLGP